MLSTANSTAIAALAVLMILASVLGACSPGVGSGQAVEIKLAPASQLPDFVARAPLTVKEAFQFAIANPEVLERIPCFCGCGAMGHLSNLDCYVQQFKPDGSIVFDDHAFN